MNVYSMALFLHIVGAMGFSAVLALEWLRILRQLGALSSKQEQILGRFGPVKSIQNHRGIVTGQSRPVFAFQ